MVDALCNSIPNTPMQSPRAHWLTVEKLSSTKKIRLSYSVKFIQPASGKARCFCSNALSTLHTGKEGENLLLHCPILIPVLLQCKNYMRVLTGDQLVQVRAFVSKTQCVDTAQSLLASRAFLFLSYHKDDCITGPQSSHQILSFKESACFELLFWTATHQLCLFAVSSKHQRKPWWWLSLVFVFYLC